MTVLRNDIRYGFRQMLKNPGSTAVVVLTLALGIGANTAIFSVVNSVLLKPLPYREPGRIVTVLHGGWAPVSPADFLDWRKQPTVFESLAAAQAWGGTLTGQDRPEAIPGISMGEGLFELLGVKPMLGRTFSSEEFRPGSNLVLVLSHRLWQRRFGSDPGVIGRSVTLDGKSYTVVGVMPPVFRFAPFWATHAEMWAPLSLVDRLNDRGGRSLRVFGRLRSGATRRQAQSEMDAVCGRLEQMYPETNKGQTVSVDPLHDKAVGNIRPALLVLLGAVFFVLMIACGNVANLLLTLAASRRREMAVRAALGATRGTLARQLLTESLLLSLFGGAAGLFIAFWGIEVLTRLVQERILRFDTVRMDASTLIFTAVISLGTGTVFGVAPILRSLRAGLAESLKENSRGSTGGRRQGRLRDALVVCEVSVASVLLVGAGLMMRSLLKLQTIDPGFDPHNVLTFNVSLAGLPEYVGDRREAFYQALLERIEALPGVQSVSAINHLPLAGDLWTLSLAIEGRPLPSPEQAIGAAYRVCRPGYFLAMGGVLLKGRDFTERDDRDAPGVAIINEALARSQFPDQEALGKRITFDDPGNNPQWFTVVGVVKDVTQRDLKAPAFNEVYLPFRQQSAYLDDMAGHVSSMAVVVRADAAPPALVKPVERIVSGLDRRLPVSSVASLEQVIADAVWQPKFNLLLIGVFAAVGLTLAAVGIYGVVSHSVAQRTHEIGVRMALGAQATNVRQLVVRRGLLLTFCGLMIGLVGALALTRFMSAMVYGVGVTDPATFGIVSLLLGLAALLSCYLPARRAARIDPMTALRCE